MHCKYFSIVSGVFEYTKSVGGAIIVWIASGLFSTLGALCYAELGTVITRSGGDYAYILEAFGPLCAFILLWITLLILRPTTQAIVALTFAHYASKPFFPNCEPPENAVRLLAAVCLCKYFLFWFIMEYFFKVYVLNALFDSKQIIINY